MTLLAIAALLPAVLIPVGYGQYKDRLRLGRADLVRAAAYGRLVTPVLEPLETKKLDLINRIFVSRASYLTPVQASRLSEALFLEARKKEIDPILALAIIHVESRFLRDAVSNKGALGLMQIRPFVGEAIAREIKLPWKGDETLHDPVKNIKIGLAYFDRLNKRFHDVGLALTAYNWGPTRLRSMLSSGERPPTRYSEKVLGKYREYLGST